MNLKEQWQSKHSSSKQPQQDLTNKKADVPVLQQASLGPRSLATSNVLQLQHTIGNQALGQMFAQKQQQPIQRAPNQGVIQRLKKGDFKDLAKFGLDVGTWIEFAEEVKKMSYSALKMASTLLELKLRQDTNSDLIRARMLIDKQKYKLVKPPRSGILDLYFGGDELGAKTEEIEEDDNEREQQIVVGDGIAETTVIKTTSDLLIWLVSHPAGSKKTPRSFAETDILNEVLNKLWKENRIVEPPEVWAALRQVMEKRNSRDERNDEEPDVSGDNEDNELAWEDGGWAEKEEFGLIFKEPARYRRKMPEEDYKAANENLLKKLAGYKMVGLHATRIESLGSLVTEGVSKERFNTGHGLGKGAGFYIVPTSGTVNKNISEAAKSWGSQFVAVYLPIHCESVGAVDGENVQTLEEEHQGENCYYMFGNAEAVIPPSLCDAVILVCDPSNISTADPKYEAEVDPREPFEFVKSLPKRVRPNNK